MELPHIELDSNTLILALDCECRSNCDLYQARLKDYHESHCLQIGDLIFFAKMKPKELDSNFAAF